jgi:hypothetical protein
LFHTLLCILVDHYYYYYSRDIVLFWVCLTKTVSYNRSFRVFFINEALFSKTCFVISYFRENLNVLQCRHHVSLYVINWHIILFCFFISFDRRKMSHSKSANRIYFDFSSSHVYHYHQHITLSEYKIYGMTFWLMIIIKMFGIENTYMQIKQYSMIYKKSRSLER